MQTVAFQIMKILFVLDFPPVRFRFYLEFERLATFTFVAVSFAL
jgi:hypothetical protein